MGKLNDSLLSGSYGRTGRLVVANVAGTEILRIRPKKRTTASTPNQMIVQQRMKLCYDFISSYKAFAKKHFGVKVGMRSCYNLAITNLLNAFKIDFATLQITPDYQEIFFAKGGLLAPVITGLAAPALGSFQIQWYNNSGSNPDHETDLAQVLYVADDNVRSVFIENMVPRADGLLDVQLAPNWQGKTVHVWLAFRSQDELIASDSVYAGSVLIS